MRKTLAAIILANAAVLGAAEKISYEELRANTDLQNDAKRWSFTLVTLDGNQHRADHVRFNVDHVLLSRGKVIEKVESGQIERLEVSRRFGQWSHKTLEALRASVITGRAVCLGWDEQEPVTPQKAACISIASVILDPFAAVFVMFWSPPTLPRLLLDLAAAPVYLIHDAAVVTDDPRIYEISH